jgi:hypothetical protein
VYNKDHIRVKASPKAIDQQSVNLHYIRAAIEARTGVCLTLKEVRRYLVEEKLLTPAQARKFAQIFTSYADYHEDYTGYGYSKGSYEPFEEELDKVLVRA